MTFGRVTLVAAVTLGVGTTCGDTPTEPNPLPFLYSLDPQSVIAGSPAFSLTVRGEGFRSSSRVRWDGADRPTTYVSYSELRASIAEEDVATVRTVIVTVHTGAPGGGTSGGQQFTVATPPPLSWSITSVPVPNGTWDATISSSGTAVVTRLLIDSIARINLATNSLIGSFRVGNWPYEVVFDPAQPRAFVTNLEDHTIGVINTTTNTQTATYPVPDAPIRVRVGVGSSRLYVTQIDGSVVVLDASNGTSASPPIAVGGVLNGLAMTPDGSRLWVSNTSGLVAEINTVTNTVGRSFVMGGRPQDVVISSDGSTLYVANEERWVGVYDLTTVARIDSIPSCAAFGLALNPGGSQLWVSCSVEGMVRVFYSRSRAPAGTLLTGGTPRHIAIASDGTALIANEAGVAQIARQNP